MRVRLWMMTVPTYWQLRRRISYLVFRLRLGRYAATQRGAAFTSAVSTSDRLARLFLPALLLGLATILLLDWLASVALVLAPAHVVPSPEVGQRPVGGLIRLAGWIAGLHTVLRTDPA